MPLLKYIGWFLPCLYLVSRSKTTFFPFVFGWGTQIQKEKKVVWLRETRYLIILLLILTTRTTSEIFTLQASFVYHQRHHHWWMCVHDSILMSDSYFCALTRVYRVYDTSFWVVRFYACAIKDLAKIPPLTSNFMLKR